MADFRKPQKPYAFIQWKGTDVCADIHCQCGFFGHFDGDFLYFWECPRCKEVYEMGCYVQLAPVAREELRARKISDVAIKTSEDHDV